MRRLHPFPYRHHSCALSSLFSFLIRISPPAVVLNEVPDEPAVRIGRSLALNDFEAGTFGSWLDVSAADAKWNIEDFSNPIDPSQPAPAPL